METQSTMYMTALKLAGSMHGPRFETWFFKQFVPSRVDLSGQIVLFGTI